MSNDTLLVELHGVVVGHLWSDGLYSYFSFHRSYLDSAERPVLGQYFEDRLHKCARKVRGMQPWFENVLPEQGGALQRMYSRMLGIDAEDGIGMLAALGDDLPGAVRLRSDDLTPPRGDVVEETRPHPLAVARFSLGGMQLKYSMSGAPERLTVGMSDDSGSAWILKLGGPEFPGLAENEHAIMTWCRTAGFDVPETHVVPIELLPDLGPIPDTPSGYLIRRYDREGSKRVHQEDFAQVLNVSPSRKFDSTDALGLLWRSQLLLGTRGVEEALRRLVSVVAVGNCDAHLKNWSLIYPTRVKAEWSPLYDQVATIAYPRVPTKLPMRIGTAHHINEVSRSHLRWVANKVGVASDRCDMLIDEVLGSLASCFSGQLDMSNSLTKVILQHWLRVPLLREYTLK